MAKPPITGPGISPKKAHAIAFEKALRKAIINPIHADITARVTQAGKDYAHYRAVILAVLQTPIPANTTPAQQKIIEANLNKIANQHKADFRAKMRKYLGVRVDFMADTSIAPILKTALANNVSLVKTIPKKYHAGLLKDLEILAQTKPFDQKELRGVLAKNYKSAGYNLRRLTRDQTNKLVGNLSQARQTNAGIQRYKWRTSADERVRPTHETKSGQTFAWNSPPPGTGHPGHDIQCRCIALPIVDEILKGAERKPFVAQPGFKQIAKAAAIKKPAPSAVAPKPAPVPANPASSAAAVKPKAQATPSAAAPKPVAGFTKEAEEILSKEPSLKTQIAKPEIQAELEKYGVKNEYILTGGEISPKKLAAMKKEGWSFRFSTADIDEKLTLKDIKSIIEANTLTFRKIVKDHPAYDLEFVRHLHDERIYGEYILTLGQLTPDELVDLTAGGWRKLPIPPDVIKRLKWTKPKSVAPPSAAKPAPAKEVFPTPWDKPRGSAPVRIAQAAEIAPENGRLTGAQGSNPGGVFKDASGKERYVKFYSKPEQAYAEATANQIYAELGIPVPHSTLVYDGDRLVGIANDMVEHKGTLGAATIEQKEAAEALRGFVADVWLGNWDAVGTGADNMVRAGRGIMRIDQGGTLQFRAMGGRKTAEDLASLNELTNMPNPAVNPYYADLFKTAGLNDADDLGIAAIAQYEIIVDLRARTNNFADLLPKAPGVSRELREETLAILRARADKIETDYINPLRAKAATHEIQTYTPEMEDSFKRYIGIDRFEKYAAKADDTLKYYYNKGLISDDLTDTLTMAEKAALRYYTSDGYALVNDGLRAARSGSYGAEHEYVAAYQRILNSALDKLPNEREWTFRSVDGAKSLVSDWHPGNIVVDAGLGSSSPVPQGFGNIRLRIWSETGKWVEPISEYPNENEILFRAGTKYRVISRTEQLDSYGDDTIYLTVQEITPDTPAGFEPVLPAFEELEEGAQKFWKEKDAMPKELAPYETTPEQVQAEHDAWVARESARETVVPRTNLQAKMQSGFSVMEAETTRKQAKAAKIAAIGAQGTPKAHAP